MIADSICPKCGTALSDDALEGLCRKCLGELAFGRGCRELESGNGEGVGSWRHLGHYELLEEIARGGMGVVYRARQEGLNRIVALKVLLNGPFASEQFIQRFHTEAGAVAALRHPNIVTIYEFSEQDGHHFFSMEYIQGKAFSELVREKPLPAARAATYLKTIAEAVHYAHEQGVFHRDLKPSNVLLDLFDQPRVTDFGLAKLANSDLGLTVTGEVLGSPSHMPPEQAASRSALAGPASDVYSMGALLYHLLTARPPFQGETLPEILLQLENSEPVAPRRLNPSVPQDLQTICLKCLQKEPGRRYQTARKLAEDLGRFLEDRPILARPVSRPERVWLWCKRRPVLAALSLGLVLAVLGGLAGILWEWQRATLYARGEAWQRISAEQNAAKVRLNLYAADINLASQAIQRGDYGLARRTLAGLRPQTGEKDMRGFEWRWLWKLCQGDQVATLSGHEWIVTCASFSSDGKWIATGSEDRTVKVWDASRLSLITTLSAGTGFVWSVAFSPDSRYLLTSGRGGTRLWDTDTWQVVRSFPGQIAALAKTDSVMAVSTSSPFDFRNPAGEVSLWNWRTGEKLRSLAKPGHALAFSPDGTKLAVAARPGGIMLWDARSGELLRSLSTAHSVWSLAFSPDGNQLLTTSGPREPIVWDLAGDQSPRTLKGNSLTVWSANYSPDGATIVTTGADQTVRLWNAASLELKGILRGHDHEVWCSAFSPDGKRIVTGGKDQKVMLWLAELRSRADVLPNRNDMRPVFSSDGERITTVGKVGGSSTLWNIHDRALIAQMPGRPAMGLSPDGKRIVRWSADSGALELWSPADLTDWRVPLEGVRSLKGPIEGQGFSPEWRIFFVIDSTGLVRFWRADTGKSEGSWQGSLSPLRASALGPGGRYFALGAEQERVVRLYDRTTGHERSLEGHRDSVSGLAFSADGAMLASGSLDGTIRLWDPVTGAQRGFFPGHMQEASDVAFSPDGRTLASVNLRQSIKLWHIPTGRELLVLELPHAGDILQFAPNGSCLAVTTDENSVRLFEAPLSQD